MKLSEKLRLELEKELKKRRKWLSAKAFSNCFLVSMGIVIITWAFEAAELIQRVGQTVFPFNILWMFVGLVIVTFTLWFYGLMAPDLVEAVFKMLGFEVKEENKQS